jgi:hypothetical protein
MSSTLTAVTEATTFAQNDLFYAVVGGNSRKVQFANLLSKPAANVLEQVNGTNAQTFRVYHTFTDTSNYERVALGSGTLFGGVNVMRISSESAGTGQDDIVINLHAQSAGNVTITNSSNDNPRFQVALTTEDFSRMAVGLTPTANEPFIGMGPGSATRDTFLYRDSAGIFAIRNGINAETLRLYRTFTDSANYERLALQTGSAYVQLAAETAGTGADNMNIVLTPTGTGASAGGVVISSTSTANPNYYFAETSRLLIDQVGTGACLAFNRWEATSSGATLNFGRSRSGTVGTFTVLQIFDQIASIRFWGADGTDFAQAAEIAVYVNGTPGSGDMPGMIQLRVSPDGSETVDTRMQIDASSTATHTGMMLYDVDNATLERVTVGIADSGGGGFKVLRIPN